MIVSERCDMRHDFGHLLDFLQHLRKVKVRHCVTDSLMCSVHLLF